MERLSSTWKDRDEEAPVDRMVEVIQRQIDQLQHSLRGAVNAGETGDGYLAMLEESADRISQSIDTYIATKKGTATGTESRDAAHDARMDRLSNAWKDDEKTLAEKKADSKKRTEEQEEARNYQPVTSSDSQATTEDAFRAKQQRTADAWKGDHAVPQGDTAPDLQFGMRGVIFK